MPPINGDIFLKKMDQFLTRTDLYTKSTERLISRMEDFFMQEKDKDKKEKKLKQKEVYVKVKDPLASIDARIGKSNVLLEDILKSIKRNGGSAGGGGFGFDLSNLPWKEILLGAGLSGLGTLIVKEVKDLLKGGLAEWSTLPDKVWKDVKQALQDRIEKSELPFSPEQKKKAKDLQDQIVDLRKQINDLENPRMQKKPAKNVVDWFMPTWETPKPPEMEMIYLKQKLAEVEKERHELYDAVKGKKPGVKAPEGMLLKNTTINSIMQNVKQYDELIEKAAKEKGMDPNLLRALMAQESGGQNVANTKDENTHARGLYQLQPATQLGLEKQMGKIIDPFNPQDAIEAATKLYQDAFARYKTMGYSDERAKYLAIMDHNYGTPDVLRSLGKKEGDVNPNVDPLFADKVLGFYNAFSNPPKLNQNNQANMPNPIETDNGIFQVLRDGVHTTISQDSMEQLADTMAQAWKDTVEAENRKFMGEGSGMSQIGNIRQ